MSEPDEPTEATLPTSDCTVCTHPAAAAIDAGLLAGTTVRATAETFGVSRSAVGRHKVNHLSLGPIADEPATERSEMLRLVDVHGQLANLADRLEKVVESAARTRKATAAVSATRELRQTLMAIAEVQSKPELQQAASLQELQAWTTRRAVAGLVRMLDFVVTQFGLPSRNIISGGPELLNEVVAGLIHECLLALNDDLNARFEQVDISRARAFVEQRALDRAAAVEEEVQRRVEVELRRREAQARPAIEVHERLAIEGGGPVWG